MTDPPTRDWNAVGPELLEALEAIAWEAERENGGWVHLKRIIGTKARDAIAKAKALSPSTPSRA